MRVASSGWRGRPRAPDIDLDDGYLVVRHTLQQGTHALVEPKTEQSRRTIRLPATVRVALAEHRERQTIVPLSGLVFTSSKGTALDSRNVTRSLHGHLVRLGLPPQRFHDLRHCFATLALESGADLLEVSHGLGHAKLSTTADVYAHFTDAMRQRLADRMDVVLSG